VDVNLRKQTVIVFIATVISICMATERLMYYINETSVIGTCSIYRAVGA